MKTYPIQKNNIYIKCCVCHKVKVIDENTNIFYQTVELPLDAEFTFGYCPDCAKEAIENHRAYMRENSIMKGKEQTQIQANLTE